MIAKGGRAVLCRCGGVSQGRWHFVAVTHARLRGAVAALAMFQKDSVTVSLDLVPTLTLACPVPRVVAEPLDCAAVALGLDGQLGEVTRGCARGFGWFRTVRISG